ncbi:MAG: hypothetical protein KF900_04925 [Bacteroidetes bacterium]|nr:hypothetical protein [Bacteroidota bacterium]
MKIAGIKTEKYANGNIKSITFDYKKHQAKLKPVLKDIGFLKAEDEDDEFERLWNNPTNLTAEQLATNVKKRLREVWKNTK